MSRGPDRSIESGPDPLRLEQVPAFVPRQDFESRAHREADHPDKRVLETDPVDVVVTRALHELTDGTVGRVEPVEHGRRDLGARSDLLGSPAPPIVSVTPGKIGDSAARSETGTVLVFTTRLSVSASARLAVRIGGRAAEGTRLESA